MRQISWVEPLRQLEVGHTSRFCFWFLELCLGILLTSSFSSRIHLLEHHRFALRHFFKQCLLPLSYALLSRPVPFMFCEVDLCKTSLYLWNPHMSSKPVLLEALIPYSIEEVKLTRLILLSRCFMIIYLHSTPWHSGPVVCTSLSLSS